MQGRTRAKKSNKNIRAVQQVDFSLLTEEQKESSSARKELDVFIANPVPKKPQAQERIPSVFLTVDRDAFAHPRPLEKDLKEVMSGRAASAAEQADTQEPQETGAQAQQRAGTQAPQRTGAFMPQRSDAQAPQSAGAPARYPERRQRIPSEAEAEWHSRRKMRGETPAQKAYRAAMHLPGASQPLTPPLNRPVPPAPTERPAAKQPVSGVRQAAGQLHRRTTAPADRLAGVQRETQSFKPVRPGTTRIVTPEPVREQIPPAEPAAPKMTPLLPADSPLSDAAPAEKKAPAVPEKLHIVPDVLLEDDRARGRASKGKSRKKNGAKQKKKKKRPAEDNTISTDLQTEIPVRAGRSTTRPQAFREEREKRRKKEERLTYIIVACVILFLVAGFFLFRIYMNYRRSADEYAELNETYVVMPAETVTEEAEQEEAAAAPPYPQLEINFASLHSLNEDFVGWIYVPGCGISYPIVRGQDNDYYLNHTFLKSEASSGAIFMDYQDAAGFIDFNTFIYGHNLKDGTMFTALADYRQNTELIRDYPYFYIYLNNRSVKKYRICAFYNDDGYSDSYFRVTTPEDRAAYVAMINSKSLMTQGFGLAEGEHAVTGDDLLVTLSTCEDSVRSGRRFLVHGYLVETFTSTGGTQQ